MVNLGAKVRDRISGFKGVAVARTERLYDCVRIGVLSQKLKDGQVTEPQWFDEAQVEVVRNPSSKSTAPGGPSRPTGQRIDPKR